MEQGSGFLNGFGYLEIEMPDGSTIQVKPLGIGKTVSLIRQVKGIYATHVVDGIEQDVPGTDDRLIAVCETVVSLIEPPESRAIVEQLQPMEVVDLATDFFFAARTHARQAVRVRGVVRSTPEILTLEKTPGSSNTPGAPALSVSSPSAPPATSPTAAGTTS